MIDDQPIGVQRSLQGGGVSAGARVFSQADDGEGLGEDITPLAQGSPVSGDGEEHAAVGIKAVLNNEVEDVARGVQPFAAALDFVVQFGEHPEGAALQPHRLVAIEDAAVAIKRVELTAMLPIQRVIQPKGDDLVKKLVAIDLAQFKQARAPHPFIPETIMPSIK